MSYQLEFTRAAQGELRKLDKYQAKLITRWLYQHIDGVEDPRAFGKGLVANNSVLWRYRIGDYRVIVEIEDQRMIVLAINIGHKRFIMDSQLGFYTQKKEISIQTPVKATSFTIYYVSSEATTKRFCNLYGVNNSNGTATIIVGRALLANTSFPFDKIAIIKGYNDMNNGRIYTAEEMLWLKKTNF